ncbi:MAG: sn-glycerol-3-phosphate ABC transporter ATP-binding protein UgpC [Acidihalobacter sp.]
MAEIELRKLGKTYGRKTPTTVLSDVDLTIGDGEFIVFLGPSGCGKTTLLRMIAGLEEITAGDLLIDGERANELPPVKRRVALVFQSYALYPHMSVFDNMAFGLKLQDKRGAREEIARRVREAAALLQIDHLLERKPRQLSGGQRQRVAIGRAIVREPALLLMDEPLSNLDAALRGQMRLELIELHRRLGNTTVYVTHDQVEAMTLGDRIAIINEGRIVQVGPPLEVYHRPANRFVAAFIGSPRMNIVDGSMRLDGGAVRVELGDGLSLAADVEAPQEALDGTAVSLGVRPEDLAVCAPGQGELRGRVRVVEPLGEATVVHVRLDSPEGADIAVRAHGTLALEPGAAVGVRVAAEHCHVFDGEGRAMRRLHVPERMAFDVG